MSLLLIVLLLDISHLELVEDVLKETNFNDEDWRQLGRELGVYMKYGYPENLKDCLREWLNSGGTFSSGSYMRICNMPPTLDDLAAALKSIGYKEAGEYIIKTCKLVIMFNDQCY